MRCVPQTIDDLFEIKEQYTVDLTSTFATIKVVQGNKTGHQMMIENVYMKNENKLELFKHELTFVDAYERYEKRKRQYDTLFEREYYFGNRVS